MILTSFERMMMGNYFADIRRAAGLAQADIAEHLGFSSSQYISNIERGLCNPSREYLMALCEMDIIKVEDLLEVMQQHFYRSLETVLRGE